MAPIQTDERDINLLVLPALSSPGQRSSLWAAYRSTFEAVLLKVARPDSQIVSRLDIAVTLPASRTHDTRTANYPEDHLILQEIYTLTCLAAARTNTELDFPGGVDVRVFLLTVSQSEDTSSTQFTEKHSQWLSGPVVSIKDLAASARPYKSLYGVEGEQGEAIMQTLLLEYRKQRKSPPTSYRLPSGPYMSDPSSTATQKVEKQVNTHHNVAVGGTFDHLHLGHKLLLTALIYLSDPVRAVGDQSQTRTITVGITGDEMLVKKKHPQHLESWEIRQQRTHAFIDSVLAFYPSNSSQTSSSGKISISQQDGWNLSTETTNIDKPGPNGKTVRVTYTLTPPSPPSNSTSDQSPSTKSSTTIINYTRISDPFGPTITDESITALIISAETRQGGQAVNDKRREKNWHELEVFEVGILDADVEDVVDDDTKPENMTERQKEGFEGKISSTDIRRRLDDLEKELSTNKKKTKDAVVVEAETIDAESKL